MDIINKDTLNSETEEQKKVMKRTIKDSVFTDLFKNIKYTFQLYKALHPEDEDVTKKDIIPITLENILLADIYNDLGFQVKDKILILVEAQSTWTMNIIIRMLMYLAETYNKYFKKTKQSLYGSKKVSFPKPELYMIYIGEKGNKKEIISLTEEFLGGKESSIEVKVKVIFDGKKGDIINQYITFTKIYNEQVKVYGRTRKAVMETIRICTERDVLKEYLIEREKEVISIMMSLFDKEEIFDTFIYNVAKESEEKGRIISTIEMCKEFGISFSDTVNKISSKFSLTKSEAENKVKECW